MTKSELISLVPNKPYRMPCCRECMGKPKKDCDDNPLNCFDFYLLNKNTIDKIRENLQRNDKQMRDKLKSLIDTFFCSVDIDKFYAQNQKEKLAVWLRENGVIVPPCKVGDTVYRILYHHDLKKYIIVNYKVTEILYSSNRGVRPFIFVTNVGYRFDNCDIYPDKDILLSKREAKKVLAEREAEEP